LGLFFRFVHLKCDHKRHRSQAMLSCVRSFIPLPQVEQKKVVSVFIVFILMRLSHPSVVKYRCILLMSMFSLSFIASEISCKDKISSSFNRRFPARDSAAAISEVTKESICLSFSLGESLENGVILFCFFFSFDLGSPITVTSAPLGRPLFNDLGGIFISWMWTSSPDFFSSSFVSSLAFFF